MKQTSIQAFYHIRKRIGKLQGVLYTFIRQRGGRGATDEEIFSEFRDISQNTLRPRRNELVKLGMIKDSGKRRKNIKSGRRAIVWKIK